MSTRKNFEMTSDDLKSLLDAMTSTPLIMLQCGMPPSAQERANAAWEKLGAKYGFSSMTVQPLGFRGDRFFSAVELKPHLKRDGDKWMASWPGFIDLQQSSAGFGDTESEAIAELKAKKSAA